MKKYLGIVIVAIAVLLLVSGYFLIREKETVSETLVHSLGTDKSNSVEMYKVNKYVWVHRSYGEFKGNWYEANGMVVEGENGLILVDTPWNEEQTKSLMTLCSDILEKPITLSIVTHAHSDTMGGIGALLDEDIRVLSTEATVKEAEKNKFRLPEGVLGKETVLKEEGVILKTFYPGAGHTSDNLVVYLPDFKVLFGGCLLKSLEAEDLGNTAEANLEQWPVSIDAVAKQYPKSKVVIPGHGPVADRRLFHYTKELLEKNK